MAIKITWIIHTNPPVPIVLDTERYDLVDDITDYAIHLQDKELCSYEYVKNEIRHLALFQKYIGKDNTPLRDVTNEVLRNFREDDLKRLRGKSLVSEKKLKRVVNNRLSRIYNFFHWYQTHHSVQQLIGATRCAITSDPTIKSQKNKSPHQYTLVYPLNYRRIGRGSKHATEHSATEDELNKIELHFRKIEDEFIAERNSLIMAIANTAGFRRASINSLRCEQFSESKLKETLDDYIIVKPDEQKFDANINYKIPILLAYRISEFVTKIRSKFLYNRGISSSLTKDRLFISSRNGHPLKHASISDIFTSAFRAIGSEQPRTSIHSIRRKFANDRIVKNLEQRIELKLDVSDASISAAVSMELGHSDPDSIRPYISRIQQQMVTKLHQQKNEVIRKLFEENIRLKNEIDKLKKSLD